MWPRELIQIRVFFMRELVGSEEGSWIPTEICRVCVLARDCRPRTKGEVVTGRQRERDSWDVEAR